MSDLLAELRVLAEAWAWVQLLCVDEPEIRLGYLISPRLPAHLVDL